MDKAEKLNTEMSAEQSLNWIWKVVGMRRKKKTNQNSNKKSREPPRQHDPGWGTREGNQELHQDQARQQEDQGRGPRGVVRTRILSEGKKN